MDKLKACPFTRKEKIAVNNLKIDNGNGAYILKRDADVILRYIQFLQSEVERLSAEPENKPLTLEQLRKMDGEPVYIILLDIADKFWLIREKMCWIDTYSPEPMSMFHCNWYKWSDYGKTWLAYARKPEQEEK